MKLLIINPGSTSTKISVYDEYEELFVESVFHDAPELLKYPHVNGQVPFRKKVILGSVPWPAKQDASSPAPRPLS